MNNWFGALALGVACSAGAAEVRAGAGLGVGAFAGLPSSPLLSPRFDLQVEAGEGATAFFAAVRFGAFVTAPHALFAPSFEVGARWHLTRQLTVGLAVAAGLVVFLSPSDGSVFLVGATIEPFTWAFTAHHEVGLTIGAFLPAGVPPPVRSQFSVLVLPTAGYTYRF